MGKDVEQRIEQLRNPAGWLALFGPGAIVASLTIGAGELVFSSRGGALFGYRLLGLFLIICVLKWSLVLATARHIVLTGAHPLQRWVEFPGPRGWLPMVFLLLAVASFPVWVGFHAGTVGTLLASLTGTQDALRGASHFVWGLLVLAATMVLVWTGSYQRLERIQIGVVALMLGCVSLSLYYLQPDWRALVLGLFQLSEVRYPEWIDKYPQIAQRPLWVELATYVGVIGGSGYDYLAYVSFLRDKHWGGAAQSILDGAALQRLAAQPRHPNRQWLVAPLIDATLSFSIVFLFSAVFLTLGTLVLHPAQKVPSGTDLLTLQAEFVGAGAAALKPIYFVGALLAMLGTLYGTIEVAPTVARELGRALVPTWNESRHFHRRVTAFVGVGGALVLLLSLAEFARSGSEQPPGLIAILTPANLFTGVLACGLIAHLAVWADWRWLPRQLRMGWLLVGLNTGGGLLFLLLGLKAYWDHGGATAWWILAGTVCAGLAAAWFGGRGRGPAETESKRRGH